MRKFYLFMIIGALLGLNCDCAGADITKREARLLDLDGEVQVMLPGSGWVPASQNMALTDGSRIRTRANSSAILNVDGMAQTATVEIKENSELRLTELSADTEKDMKNTFLDLYLGKLTIKVIKTDPDKAKFRVKTPTSVIDVSGATFAVSVEAVED